jgi:AraC-like DNA-binding protein
MIFHRKDVYKQFLADGRCIDQPRSFVFGQITQPLYIQPTGLTSIFAVRFLQAGFFPFISRNWQALENRAVPLEELFGHEGIDLEDKLMRCSSVPDCINAIESFLLDRLTGHLEIDKIIKSSIELIYKLNGQLSVGELSVQIGVNRRDLERRFSSVIGLSPKQLARISRLQSVLSMMVEKDFDSLTTLAYQENYYDQAHFIKDFKIFTGVSPKKFFDDQLRLATFFFKGS